MRTTGVAGGIALSRYGFAGRTTRISSEGGAPAARNSVRWTLSSCCGSLSDAIALDAMLSRKVKRPLTSRGEAAFHIGTWLQERKNIRQRIHKLYDGDDSLYEPALLVPLPGNKVDAAIRPYDEERDRLCLQIPLAQQDRQQYTQSKNKQPDCGCRSPDGPYPTLFPRSISRIEG
jgi:hypothetical protein